MFTPFIRGFSLGCVLVFLGLALAAQAGPKEDTEQAEKSFRGGDLPGAMALLKKAADQGYAPAQARLADLLDAAELDGEAVALYRKAAEQGEPAGEYGLGRMYANGEGVKRDAEQALQWFRRAAEKRYLPAVEIMAQIYRKGELGLAANAEEARKWDAEAKQIQSTQKANPQTKDK